MDRDCEATCVKTIPVLPEPEVQRPCYCMNIHRTPLRQASMQRDGLAARVRDLELAAAALRARAERAVELERLLGEAAAGRDAAEAARARLLHTRDELATSLLVGTLTLPEVRAAKESTVAVKHNIRRLVWSWASAGCKPGTQQATGFLVGVGYASTRTLPPALPALRTLCRSPYHPSNQTQSCTSRCSWEEGTDKKGQSNQSLALAARRLRSTERPKLRTRRSRLQTRRARSSARRWQAVQGPQPRAAKQVRMS